MSHIRCWHMMRGQVLFCGESQDACMMGGTPPHTYIHTLEQEGPLLLCQQAEAKQVQDM
jgi:hypothetical protein